LPNGLKILYCNQNKFTYNFIPTLEKIRNYNLHSNLQTDK
jgi:hypothetical protein